MKKAILLSSLATLLGLASISASADTIKTFTLTQNGCSGGCGTGPYGTVTLTQSGSNVNVDLTLAPLPAGVTENFAGTGAGQALEFNVLGATTADITGITSGFVLGPAPATASTFGSFLFSITCPKPTCQGGSGLAGPLDFTVLDASIADFVANAGGYYFASDVAVHIGDATGTGNVAALGGTTPPSVPEPSSLLLFGTGLTAIGGMLRRRMADLSSRS